MPDEIKSAEFADKLKKIAGTEIDVISKTDFIGETKQFLAINIGDSEIADKTIDELVPLRAKAGLSKGDLPFSFEPGKGLILIPAEAIEQYDAQHGKDELFKKLASVNNDFANIISAAKANADKAAKTPTLTNETAFDAWFIDDADGKQKYVNIDIENGDFSKLPPEAVNEAIRLTKDVRGLLKEDEAKIGSADPAQIKQFAPAASIDGDPTTLTDKELAAWMLAKSMENPVVSQTGEVTQRFDNSLSAEELLKTSDPKLVFETARQIFGDAMKESIKDLENTTSSKGNDPYLSAVGKSPDKSQLRC